MAEDLKYTIGVTADTSGAKDAARELGKVDAAAKAVGPGAASAGKAVSALGEDFEKGAAAGRVLEQAARGNVAALGQLGPAIKAIGTLMKTNLIGVLITLGAVAAQIAIPFIKGFLDKKKAVEDVAAALEKAKKKAEELGAAKLAALQFALDEIADKSAKAIKELNELADAQERIATLRDDVERAEIEGDSSLSSDERARRLAGLDDRAAMRRAGGTEERAAGELAIRQRQQAENQASEETEARRLAAAQAEADAAAADVADPERGKNRRRNALREELRELARQQAAASRVAAGKGSSEDIARAESDPRSPRERIIREGQIRQELRGLSGPKSDGRAAEKAESRQAEATIKLETAQKAVNTATSQALKSTEQVIEAEQRLARVRAANAAEEPLRQRAAATRLQTATAPAVADRQTQIRQLQAEAEAAEARKDFAAQDIAVRERRKLLAEQAQARPAQVPNPAGGQTAAGVSISVPPLDAAPVEAALEALSKELLASRRVDQAQITRLNGQVEQTTRAIEALRKEFQAAVAAQAQRAQTRAASEG